MAFTVNKKHLTLLPAFYFMALGTTNIIGDIFGHAFNLFDLFIFVMFSVPLFIKRRVIYQAFGTFYSVVWAYLLLALTSDYVHYASGRDHYQQPGVYFGVGYIFFTLSLACAILLIYIGAKKLKPVAE